jgi:N-acetylmuramoyl-L-alanine amidase
VNIRTSPSVNANVLDIMPFGAQASAVGRNAANNWIQVMYGDTTGWVAAWVVVASDNTADLRVASEVVDVAPIPTGTQITGSSIYAVVIRSGPGLTFGPVGEVPANTNANLLGRTEDSEWVKVNYEGVEGWVAAWVLVASADMNNLPVQNQ